MFNQYQEYYLKTDDIVNITVFLCFLNSFEFSTVNDVDVVSKRVQNSEGVRTRYYHGSPAHKALRCIKRIHKKCLRVDFFIAN